VGKEALDESLRLTPTTNHPIPPASSFETAVGVLPQKEQFRTIGPDNNVGRNRNACCKRAGTKFANPEGGTA
jgi:hypothetical protein